MISYNGVAILSRADLQDIIVEMHDYQDPQRRLVAATLNDTRILNLYIPNGESTTSEKYQYKLSWLKKLDEFIQKQLQTYPKMLLLGDFNIAPDNIDVHDPAAWENSVLFSLPERQAFQGMLKMGFKDCFRQLSPEDKSYTWWDYRMNAFRRNLGLRIDHIL